MSLKKILKTTLISCFLTTLLVFSAFAEEKTIIVEGEAEIISSHDVAEQSAIASALRNAVEQTSGVYLQSETKTQNFQVINDEIYTKAQGYVSSREIIDKGVKNGLFWVKVKAQVSMEPLLESMKKLGLLRKWTVAVIADSSDEKKYTESAVNSINQIIIDNGFRVVDNNVIASLEKPEILTSVLNGNYLAATSMLKDNAVDVLAICKTSSENIAGNNFDAYGVNVTLISSKGRVEAKLVRADTGELLGSKQFEKVSVGAGDSTKAQALKEVGTEVGNYFVNQIIKLPASTATYIQLYVKGLSFGNVKNLTEMLKGVRGIRKVVSKTFKNKEAIYEIETDGDANLLAGNISENTGLTKNFKFDITSVSSGKIEALCQ